MNEHLSDEQVELLLSADQLPAGFVETLKSSPTTLAEAAKILGLARLCALLGAAEREADEAIPDISPEAMQRIFERANAAYEANAPSVVRPAQTGDAITVLLRKILRGGLKLIDCLGTAYEGPQWEAAPLALGTRDSPDLARSSAQEMTSQHGTLTWTVHVGPVDLELAVTTLGGTRFKLSLRLTEPGTGVPVPGCTVRWFTKKRLIDQTRSDDNGYVRFPEFPVGSHELVLDLEREQKIVVNFGVEGGPSNQPDSEGN